MLGPRQRNPGSTVVLECAAYLIAVAIILVSIDKPGHTVRQLDLVAAGTLLVITSLSRPNLMVTAVAACIVFVPGYLLPTIGVVPGNPPALLCLVVAIALGITSRRPRSRVLMTSLDWMTLAVFVLMLGAVVDHIRDDAQFIQVAVQWLAPYGCGRLLGVSANNRDRIARTLVVSGVLLAPFVLIESVTGFNPFREYLLHGSQKAVYGSVLVRSGAERASASFGQPIALSMFLALALLFSGALCLGAKTSHELRRWAMASGVLLVCQAATVSRTGWLMLAVGLVYAALVMPNRPVRRRLRIACVTGLAAVVLIGQVAPASISAGIPVVGKSTNETQASSDYRSGLLHVALDDGVLRPFGTVESSLADRVSVDYSSIDNEYLYLADQFGYVPALALLAIFPLVLILAFIRVPARELDVMYVGGALALFVAISTVAFLTQQQVMFWLILGLVSGIFAAQMGVDTRPSRALTPAADVQVPA